MLPIGAIIDWGALASTLLAAAVAGMGIMLVFSLAILGSTRAAETRRDDRRGAAFLYISLAVVAVLACVAAIVAGLVVMAQG